VDEPIRTLERDPQASSKGMGRGGGADGAGLALKVVNYSMNERPPSGQVLGYRTQQPAGQPYFSLTTRIAVHLGAGVKLGLA
jgi:hypothetical protein